VANTGVMRRIAARPPLRRLRFGPGGPADPAELLELEWLVTNGIGGYASGTVAGVPTRRYHGLLVAALGTPLGRTLMLNHLSEEVRLPDGTTVRLGGEERLDALDVDARHLVEFRLESGLPIWSYDLGGGHVLEKSIVLLHGQNTVHVSYRLAAGDGPVRLKLYPGIDVRPHDAPFSAELTRPYRLTSMQDRFELDASGAEPPLRLRVHGQHTVFTVCWRTVTQLQHRTEAARGYGSVGALCRPGHFRATLTRDHGATLVASTEPWEVVQALSPTQAIEAERMRRARLIAQAHPSAHSGPAAELVLAADAFLVTPSWRVEDTLRAQASGTTARSVIAGYHWFTDWGRDTMISLEGLCLSTGRHDEARQVLLTFARYVKDGLIPNLFPEGANEGLYNTADATLWFFHAVDRYVDVTGDDSILQLLVPTLREVVGCHLHGTRFGIGVDPADGLLRQHADGFALTWMDAKMGDWVVTPRRGKAVEINALWFNALRLLAGWVEELDGAGHARWLEDAAEKCRRSFNARFWKDELGHLLDVVDGPAGDDPACRPNQVFAIALRHPVLDEARWGQVLEVVERRLLTPVGLRSLAPGHPDYKPRYFGDLRARDAAYHQGTVWAWLIGPYVDAWLKVHPEDRAGARRLLQGFVAHLDQACVGTISEVFDAEGAYTARGCIAQAWSVAEALRVWVKTADSPES
jgi:predicted glycogen debranching enzyme